MPDSSPGKKRISLLYVEDDPLSRDLINRIISLKFSEVEVHIAENGGTGLALFMERMPQIVMTDIRMPVMDGVTMASEIKALCPETVIIIVAGNCDTDYLLNDKDIDYCIAKPIDRRVLFSIIKKSIAGISAQLD